MKAVSECITVYEALTRQMLSGTWTISLALYTKAQTLDRYYHIYQLLNEYEPERSRGYRARFCYNLQVCSTLWGGVSKERRIIGRGYTQACRRNDGEKDMDIDLIGIIFVALAVIAGAFLKSFVDDFRYHRYTNLRDWINSFNPRKKPKYRKRL